MGSLAQSGKMISRLLLLFLLLSVVLLVVTSGERDLARDTDGDGLRDYVNDPDDDNDGILDIHDDDDDGDGILDAHDEDWHGALYHSYLYDNLLFFANLLT